MLIDEGLVNVSVMPGEEKAGPYGAQVFNMSRNVVVSDFVAQDIRDIAFRWGRQDESGDKESHLVSYRSCVGSVVDFLETPPAS